MRPQRPSTTRSLPRRRRPPSRRPSLEWLDRRALLAASPLTLAPALHFNAHNEVRLPQRFLSTSTEVDLYATTLRAGDTIDAKIVAVSAGSGLASLLRVFDASGRPLALDNREGGDPRLTFQAAATGTYYIGVSSAPNDDYNPAVPNSGTKGGTIGLYELDVGLAHAAPLLPDVTGSSFRTGVDTAAPGDAIPVDFTVENRGGADPGAFRVEVLLSRSNRFDASSQVLATFSRAQLVPTATGRGFSSPGGFAVTLPEGLASGNAFLGLRIVADPSAPQAGKYNKSGVHRGSDWETLTLVTPAAEGATDLAEIDAGLRTEVTGYLGLYPTAVYTVTVGDDLGHGTFTAAVSGSGGFRPRLTLFGPSGRTLVQSDSGRLVQALPPGTYTLTVTPQAGAGAFRMTTSFTEASPLLSPLPTGKFPKNPVLADLNNDGILDLAVPNYGDSTISVSMGNGDGTFQPRQDIEVPALPRNLEVADLTGDGILDIVIANYRSDTVGVLLGNGDGTFQPEAQFEAGIGPFGLAVADVSGDGVPDLVATNYGDGSVSVLLGNGDGSLQSQRAYPAGDRPIRLFAVDLSGDGIPDIVTANAGGQDVSVLLGQGDGTFQPPQTFPAGDNPYSLAVADFNGDGKPDVVTANYNAANTVTVLLNTGDGTFQAPTAYETGSLPETVVTADLNIDGKLDIVVNNASGNTVSFLQGEGDGTFRPQRVFPAGAFPFYLSVGDLNRDGSPDVVTQTDGLAVFLGDGDGTFQTRPGAPAPAHSQAVVYEAVADLTGDGRLDVVIANGNDFTVSVLLQNRDGTFQTRRTFPAGVSPNQLAVADVTGDGIPDIVASPYNDGDSVSVLDGIGDGTFQTPRFFGAGVLPETFTVADLRGDGRKDIVTANYGDDTVSVLLNNGDGTYQPQVSYPVGGSPYGVAVADLNGDGRPDLAVANRQGQSVSILLGQGDGTFQPGPEYPVGGRPTSIAVEDLNGDGRPDVVTAEDIGVTVLLGNGDGSFQPGRTDAVSPRLKETKVVAIADVNADGIPDLAVLNPVSSSVSVLLGKGDGTFQPEVIFPVPAGAVYSIVPADLNGDGRLDLVTGSGDTMSLLLGDGQGGFAPPMVFKPSPNFYSAAVADINGDGKPDVLQTSRYFGTLSVQLGTGTGTFMNGPTPSLGGNPLAVASADLNGDGRPDVVTSNSADDTVSVLLGNGDGTFQNQQTFDTGRNPRGVSLADVNGDGIPDITVANYDDDTVSLLLGKGDGTFRPQAVFPAGAKPYAVAVATLAGDGIPDIVVTDAAGGGVSVLPGDGRGGFAPAVSLATGRQPFSLSVGDVSGDGLADVVVGNYADDTLSVLLGQANGSFRPQETYEAGTHPSSVSIADVNGDGKPDLVIASTGDDASSVLLNHGDGTFQPPLPFATGTQPVQTLVADVNGDGLPDLTTVSTYTAATSVLLNLGGNTFAPASQSKSVEASNTPSLADVNSDGIPDSVVLDGAGNILYRKGLAGAGRVFAPPVILNPGRPARDLAIVHTGTGLAVAAADAHYDPELSTDGFVFDISLYTVAPGGAIQRSIAFTTPALPVKLIAAGLTGDGLDALIVANSLVNSVSISLPIAPGRFAAPITVDVGETPSAVSAVDVNGDLLTDVVVTNQSSGDVSVLLNDLAHTFRRTLRFAAGTEPSTIDTGSGVPVLSSVTRPVSLVAGDFLGTGRDDLAVVNRGTHTITVLPANGQGFDAATLAMSTSTSDSSTINNLPGAVVAGDFNLDGRSDLAVLMEDTGLVWVYTGGGDGTFRHTFSIPVGDGATGLALAPGNGPGLFEMLVGNKFGDVLILDGKGDGTFQISGKRVSISVVPDLLGPGQAGVLVGNQQTSKVTVQASSGGDGRYTPVSTLGGGSSGSQLAPGDVEWAFLDRGASLPDAIVVSTGSNAVVVYRTLSITDGAPVFAAPQTYFVGTAPAGVTVADVSGDGIPDLVVSNQASNDVSVLFGSYDAGGNWAGIAGPRLRAGGVGPNGVVARDLTGDGITDLVVINGDSGTITLLPGVGQGFFNDQAPRTIVDLGATLVQPATFGGKLGVGYAVTAAGNLLRFDLSNPAAGAPVVYSSEHVVAAQSLANGQVAVALASGAVNLLRPGGNGLVVASQLKAQSGTAASPSSINVVENARGGFSVLVSSQGSDTLFVYAQGGSAPPPTLASSGTSNSTGSASTGQPTLISVSSNLVSSVTNAASTSQASAGSGSASSSGATTNAVAVSAFSVTAVSLGDFSSLGNGSSEGAGRAELVGVEGNSYFSVPVLDFGSELDEEEASRMPGLASAHPIGEASSLNHLVVGIEEALNDYLGEGEALASGPSGPALDPWNADLFGMRSPSESRPPDAETGERVALPDPDAVPTDAGKNRQPDAGPVPVPSSPTERVGASLGVPAGFAAAFFLVPWLARAAKAPRPVRPSRESRR